VIVLAGGAARQVPDEPGVNVAKEKSVFVHGLANSGNILQKPLELEGTDRKKQRFLLPHVDCFDMPNFRLQILKFALNEFIFKNIFKDILLRLKPNLK